MIPIYLAIGIRKIIFDFSKLGLYNFDFFAFIFGLVSKFSAFSLMKLCENVFTQDQRDSECLIHVESGFPFAPSG